MVVVVVALSFHFRRDDAAVAALAAGVVREIIQGSPSARTRLLLLSMGSRSLGQIEALNRHGDASIAGRARRALAISSSCIGGERSAVA
jgi:hypothetical protein